MFCVSRSTPKHADFLQKKRFAVESLEVKLDTGLDRSLNAVITWVKNCLQNEQKKTDFKPETDVDTLPTQVQKIIIFNQFFYY